ncbi:MAG: hypothetical protein AB7V46_21770 [Thermomicrobiales bacterium]
MTESATPIDSTPILDEPPSWHVAWKVFASLMLLFHLVSMVVASYCAGPASELAYAAYDICGPYAQVLYVNHGYRFFSPEPGPGNLVEFDALLSDGTRQTETMPNRGPGGQWPRVFYHRHFMLTEFLAASRDRPQTLELVLTTYASQFLRTHPETEEVTLVHVVHMLPPPEFILAGGDLRHESNYARETLGTFRWDSSSQTAVRVDGAESTDSIPAPPPAAVGESTSPAAEWMASSDTPSA